MKKYILSILILGTVTLNTHAQNMNITFLPTNPFFFSVDQAWGFTVLRTGVKPVNAVIEVAIYRNGSVELARFKSGMLQLETGGNLISSVVQQSFTSNYSGASQATFFRNTGLLPQGVYSMCVWIRNSTSQVLANSCQEFTVTVISPPILTYPFNEDTIYTTTPLLTWIPVIPTEINGLNYHLELWEVQENGSALRGRTTAARTTINDFPYHEGLMSLEIGHTYEWTVSAFADEYYLGESQLWRFTVGEEVEREEEEDTIPSYYRILGDETPGAGYVAEGVLRIGYNNLANDPELVYQIITSEVSNDTIVTITDLPEITLTQGFNQIDLDLEFLNSFDDNQEYILEVEDGNEKRYYLYFLYVNPQ